METPSSDNASFSDEVRLFVKRHADLSRTLVRLCEESGDDPPGTASLQELLSDLNRQVAEVRRPRKVSVTRLAVECSSPLDVAGDTYRSAFHALVDIAKRVILARYDDVLAPLAILVADLRPESRFGKFKWNEVRESIVQQAEVHRIARHLKVATEAIDAELALPEDEPRPTEREVDRWLDRLSRLGRRRPDEGAKAMWRRLSLVSYEKSRKTFSYDDSFGCMKPDGGWNGADHRARNKLKNTRFQGKPILDEGGRGQHILRWRLPRWFLEQMNRDWPLRGTRSGTSSSTR
jgi:hypothetical protein